ncbi:MAG: carbohydrate-binding domain-containing protein, partial [Lachnospiraceae bacterium]
VTLILDNLTLANSETAPIIVKKNSSVLLKLEGTSTITNNEAPEKETTDPDNFEGAAVKVKSGSSLAIFGSGTINAIGNAKNAIKGGAESSLTVDGGIINATAVSNGIGFDGSIVINAGTFVITAGNDGLKSEPDEGDTASDGIVTINGGDFEINAQGDGIQAAERLTINNGDFNIKTLDGYSSKSFDKDTMSCKGLKVSGNNDNETEPTNELVINGGTFELNTADDGIHSEGYCDITGGTFNIYAGDDGVHADATLTLGSENGYERDPEINIYDSYEGLEGVTVNAYSGKYYVKASDDGINAAGGSSNGTSGGNHDSFVPGGQRPGQGGSNTGGQNSSAGNYSLNISGGKFYVDCQGDGLDSNGALNLSGGDITVLSMRGGGDNSPLDADGTILINGATVFAAGSKGMGVNLSGASQSVYTNTSSYSANTVVNVSSSETVLRSEKLVRDINYLLYSAPDMGNCSVSTGASLYSCKSNAFAHSWDDGTVEKDASTDSEGLVKYTCKDCNLIEYKTIAKLAFPNEYTESDTSTEPEVDDIVYTATFNIDEHTKILVYYTQNYEKASEENVTSAIARNSDTGLPDGTGDGQINFRVVTDDGYEVEQVNVDGTYKNIKDLSSTEQISNLYRITKIESDLTITVTTTQKTDEEPSGGCIHNYATTWSKDATYHWKECECGDKIDVAEHTFDAGKVTKAATETAEGVKTYTCTVCGQTKTEAIPKLEVTGIKILDASKKEVSYVKAPNKNQTVIKVPSTITVNKVTYKVVKIEDGAFRGNNKVTRIVLPSSIKIIGKNAFRGCKKLKTISMSKNVTEIRANAFMGCTSLTKITIPSKVTKIGANAFNGCKKLKTIIIKTRKLKAKTVGKNAFKGTPKKAKMTVSKKSLKLYKKFMKNKGFKGKIRVS